MRIYQANLKDEKCVEATLGDSKFDVIVDFFSRSAADIHRLIPVLGSKCEQYIFISSACVYSRSSEHIEDITERTSKPNPLWKYNVEKYEAETALKSIFMGGYYTIIRPYITYDEERIPFGLAPQYKYHRTLIERIKCGKPMFVWRGGKALCTLTSSEDFAKGVVGLFMNDKAHNEDFHITTDRACTWNEMLATLYNALGRTLNVVEVPDDAVVKYMPEFKDMLIGDRALPAKFDNTKIKNAVDGLTFDVSLEEGIRRCLNYYETLPTFDYDYRYDACVDRMLAAIGLRGLNFIEYPNSPKHSLLVYRLYRHIDVRIADKLRAVAKV